MVNEAVDGGLAVAMLHIETANHSNRHHPSIYTLPSRGTINSNTRGSLLLPVAVVTHEARLLTGWAIYLAVYSCCSNASVYVLLM